MTEMREKITEMTDFIISVIIIDDRKNDIYCHFRHFQFPSF